MPTPGRTSLAEIVAAGRDLLEADGPPGLTMLAVAERVGVRSPSLYKRVRDRDALLRLVAASTTDELLQRVEAAEPTIAGLVRAVREFAQERPEGFRLVLTPAADPESLARLSAPLLSVAEELVGSTQALNAARLVTAWAMGFITMELSGAFRLDGDLESAFDYGLARLFAALSPPD